MKETTSHGIVLTSSNFLNIVIGSKILFFPFMENVLSIDHNILVFRFLHLEDGTINFPFFLPLAFLLLVIYS